MRVAKELKTESVSGYSNDSNPFGDSNLNEKYNFFFLSNFILFMNGLLWWKSRVLEPGQTIRNSKSADYMLISAIKVLFTLPLIRQW